MHLHLPLKNGWILLDFLCRFVINWVNCFGCKLIHLWSLLDLSSPSITTLYLLPPKTSKWPFWCSIYVSVVRCRIFSRIVGPWGSLVPAWLWCKNVLLSAYLDPGGELFSSFLGLICCLYSVIGVFQSQHGFRWNHPITYDAWWNQMFCGLEAWY